MNVHTSKKSLLRALDLMAKLIPTRSSNPLITALHVSVGAAGLTFTGTNLEADLRLHVPAEIGLGSDGEAFVLPAHLWQQMVSNAGGELIHLEKHGGEMTMTASGSVVKLQTGDVDAYPLLSFASAGQPIPVPAAELHAALSSVLYASSREAFQAVFRGVRLELRGERVRAVASDGFRLAFHDLPGISGQAYHGILPARNVSLLLPLLKDAETALLTPGDGVLTVGVNHTTANINLLDGDFPDYTRVIPSDGNRVVTLGAALLRESLQRVSVLADSNANYSVELNLSGETLLLHAESAYGRATDTLSCAQSGSAAAEPFKVNFNSKYLQEALAHCTGDVSLALGARNSPAHLTCSGVPGYNAVVVPLRES